MSAAKTSSADAKTAAGPNSDADAKTPPAPDAKTAPAPDAKTAPAPDVKTAADEIESSEYRFAAIAQTIIGAFLPLRNATPLGVKGTGNDAVLESMAADGYYRIDAQIRSEEKRNRLIIFIIDDNSVYAQHLAKFKGICARLQFDETVANKTLAQAIFIVGPGFRGRPSLTLEVKKQNAVHGHAIRFTVAPQYLFLFDITTHKSAPRKITVLTPDEVAAIMARERISPKELRHFKESDPIIVWYGAHAGQCILVESESESAGISREPYYVSA